MIRQLRRLTRGLSLEQGVALAPAVYAEAAEDGFRPRVAAEQGYEGVACVDDAARAAVLYCDVWSKHHLRWARAAAEGMLGFVTYMQESDGRFANFILDWDGRKNQSGTSSRPGGWPWTARAMHALGRAVVTLGPDDYLEPFQRGLVWLDRPCPYLDVRAVCILAMLDYRSATGSAEAADRILTWADEIADNRLGSILPDAPGRPDVHLWGHLQEAALARVGVAFNRPDLIELARSSADAIFLPAVERRFAAPTTMPFEVSSAVAGLAAVAAATGDQSYAGHTERARAWFDGRNAARRPVYNRRRGLVYDGIDDGVVSTNSGAESNVEGALALFDSVRWDRFGPDLVAAPAAAMASRAR